MAEIGTKKDPNPNLVKEEQSNTPYDLLSPSPVKDPFQFVPPKKTTYWRKRRRRRRRRRESGGLECTKVPCLPLFCQHPNSCKGALFHALQDLEPLPPIIHHKKRKKQKTSFANPCECKTTKHTQQQK
jgi:hypothetical protein